jgi:hypothetical protein
MWLFLGLPVVTFLIMGIIHASSSIDKIRQNWNEYRCNPFYIPFAGQIRPDIGVEANFQHCTNMMGQDIFRFIVDAIMSLFGELTQGLNELSGPLNLFRGIFIRMRNFIFSFAAQTFGKITNSMSSLTFILIKIRDVLQRFVGSGYIGAFLANAGIDFVVSFVMACMSVIKGFVYAILAISVLLALMGDLPMLILAITIASMIGASGF